MLKSHTITSCVLFSGNLVRMNTFPRSASQATNASAAVSPYAARAPNTPSPAQAPFAATMTGFTNAVASPHSHASRGAPHSIGEQWPPPTSVGPAAIALAGGTGPTPATATAEADALLFALLLSDTPLDLWHDVHFDSCPMCTCTGSIRGPEAGHYVLAASGPIATNTCSCGFSAVSKSERSSGLLSIALDAQVRYRHVSLFSGVFIEDEVEALGDPLLWEQIRKKPTEFEPSLVSVTLASALCYYCTMTFRWSSCGSSRGRATCQRR